MLFFSLLVALKKVILGLDEKERLQKYVIPITLNAHPILGVISYGLIGRLDHVGFCCVTFYEKGSYYSSLNFTSYVIREDQSTIRTFQVTIVETTITTKKYFWCFIIHFVLLSLRVFFAWTCLIYGIHTLLV